MSPVPEARTERERALVPPAIGVKRSRGNQGPVNEMLPEYCL